MCKRGLSRRCRPRQFWYNWHSQYSMAETGARAVGSARGRTQRGVSRRAREGSLAFGPLAAASKGGGRAGELAARGARIYVEYSSAELSMGRRRGAFAGRSGGAAVLRGMVPASQAGIWA